MEFTINHDDSAKTQIILESLELLEWPTVCNHLSTFAVTQQGRNKCKSFDLPLDISLSQGAIVPNVRNWIIRYFS